MSDPICDKINNCAVEIDKDLADVQHNVRGWEYNALQKIREHVTQLVAAYNHRIEELSSAQQSFDFEIPIKTNNWEN